MAKVKKKPAPAPKNRLGRRFWGYQGGEAVFDVRADRTLVYAVVGNQLIPMLEMPGDYNPKTAKEAARIIIRLVKLKEELSLKGILWDPSKDVGSK